MSWRFQPVTLGDMEVRIHFDCRDPPAGRRWRTSKVLHGDESAASASEGAAFLGWLGLLKALDQVLASPWEATGAKR